MTDSSRLDIRSLGDQLSRKRGREYWRGLEELADSPEFAALLRREFPDRADEWTDAPSRRRFLQLMGASIGLAAASGCGFGGDRDEVLVPPVRPSETVVPGHPQFYATSLTLGGYATGVLVKSHTGRPIKVEGNELHPASLGAADAISLASVLTLYDPDRSQTILRQGSISTVTNFATDLGRALQPQKASGGKGIRLLTEAVGSPSLRAQIDEFLKLYPNARWYQHEPAASDSARAGLVRSFGQDASVRYDLSKADVIVSLGSDALDGGPQALPLARQFADRRRLPSREMNRLYAVESGVSTMGAAADHRLRLKPSQIGAFAFDLARAVGVAAGEQPSGVKWAEDQQKWLEALAKDLAGRKGRSAVIAGESQPPHVHVLAQAINSALGNLGQTVTLADPIVHRPGDPNASLRELVGEMERGQVELLVILGGNPAYTAPADLKFTDALRKVQRSIHLSLYEDETSALCRWHVNAAHEFEAWGDARAFDGTASIVQPLIAPLYGGLSSHEIMSALLGKGELTARDVVRDHWKSQKLGSDAFEPAWEKAVHDGLIAGTAFPARPLAFKPEALNGVGEEVRRGDVASTGSLELIFRPDPNVHDGRFANNGWLQELPKPLTKLTWDNALLVSPGTARRLGIVQEGLVEITADGRTLRAAAWIDPGHADDCATLHLGYGRTKAGRVGDGAGFNAYRLRTSTSPDVITAKLVPVAGTYPLATTQSHRSMEGRDLVRTGTLAEYVEHPDYAKRHADHASLADSLYPGFKYEGYAWGMSVNLNACIGCNACVVGCQSENNIPVIGKDQVLRGREMHWIDVDRYYGGEPDDPSVEFQPRMCMHCENAPCELVCPVAATSHSAEGLNEMTYNRCVGTRYCGNNCPYKVRHFNFLEYNKPTPPSLVVLNNPDVTVRSRGVMEKCTFCVQRINSARIQAKVEGREIRDGEIRTACQQACPTRAIVFGNINDRNSEVAKLKAQPLDFGLLAELNTRPRLTYMARVRNPNPELEPMEAEHGHAAH